MCQGNQSILSPLFNKEPSEVLVGNTKREDCIKFCELYNDINEVTHKFDEDIVSCENMLNGLSNIIQIDLSNFDASKVTNMSYMFNDCQNLQKINFGEINTQLLNIWKVYFRIVKN